MIVARRTAAYRVIREAYPSGGSMVRRAAARVELWLLNRTSDPGEDARDRARAATITHPMPLGTRDARCSTSVTRERDQIPRCPSARRQSCPGKRR